jgi:flagella basal body P-ring formation protein FlgA
VLVEQNLDFIATVSQRVLVIKRGQLVTVRCLVGGVAISLQAEARAEGSLGEVIEFRKTGERDAFVATITGPNQAVINLGKS